MTYFDDPQDVIRVLQSTPTKAELEGQAAAVDMMAGAQVRPAAATAPRGRRPYRLGALIAAGVIGFGSVAAAGAGGFVPFQLGRTSNDVEDDTVIVEDAPDTNEMVEHDDQFDDEQPSTGNEDDEGAPEVEKEVTVEESAIPNPPLFADNVLTDFNEEKCLPGPHGATVSAVARGDEGFEDVDVVDAAHSDCGKADLQPDVAPEADDIDDTAIPSENPEPADDAEPKTPRPPGEHPGKGKGASGSHGHGNGNGNAKGGRGG